MPSPKPQPILLSEHQQSILERIARRQTNSQKLVRRVQIILHSGQSTIDTIVEFMSPAIYTANSVRIINGLWRFSQFVNSLEVDDTLAEVDALLAQIIS